MLRQLTLECSHHEGKEKLTPENDLSRLKAAFFKDNLSVGRNAEGLLMSAFLRYFDCFCLLPSAKDSGVNSKFESI